MPHQVGQDGASGKVKQTGRKIQGITYLALVSADIPEITEGRRR
jgi:hypothetical protein